MAEKQDDQAFEGIAGLVREDKTRAFRIFRQGSFDQKVKARIAAEAGRKRGFFSQRAIALTSAAAILLAAAVTTLLLSRRPAPAPQVGMSALMAVLEELPGVSGLVMPRETTPPSDLETFGAARAVETALTRIIEQKAAEERKADVLPGPLKVPRFSLEKKMEILFKERAIERVLASILKKSEEV